MKIAVDAAQTAATELLQAAGLEAEMAQATARRLVEGDLLGHNSHGLRMLPVYLERLGDGRIAREGRIEVLADHGASFSWSTNRLPGAWAMERLLEEAMQRVKSHPVVTATLANCSHVGALQAYLEAPARRGLLATLMVTDPGVASVAPPGGIDPVTTSNPIAACIPTEGEPLLIDTSTSLVSNGAIANHAAAGRKLPGNWVVDNQGQPSDDPQALSAKPPGTIMPLGGEDFGYKGFAFGLLVEAYALALAGYGRELPRQRGAQGVFLQLIEPNAFGHGKQAFLASTSALVGQCHASRPAPGASIRLPGERALARKASQLRDGLDIADDVRTQLDAWAQRLGCPAFAHRADH
ncbi:Ldh family oxidoreductase [Ramlibacter sp. G-1-2-2]|uniref:Ldh family oxidoreductase n=1 Tax=Ramlibacter agri TaxID=2728837 RepID=A0A848H6Q0_9BURK|nr:Ldh family oxidoreductase [Ramlibacter agri]NML46167.1 Ldh family oxidoreductase [Ramlibacter agri]